MIDSNSHAGPENSCIAIDHHGKKVFQQISSDGINEELEELTNKEGIIKISGSEQKGSPE